MKRRTTALTTALLLTSAATMATVTQAVAPAKTLNANQIAREAQRTADAQIAALKGRAPIDWVAGTFWMGLEEFGTATKNQKDLDAVTAMGDKVNWTSTTNPKTPFHADNDNINQTFLDVYETTHDAKILVPVKDKFDKLTDHLNATVGSDAKSLTWSWCDALFMAPAGMAHLTATTGDRKYADAMDKEFWRVSGVLYDPNEHLFYRDTSYLPKKSPNGKPVFWSRGDGWVIGGLAHILTYLPADYPTRDKYVALFKQMCEKLVTLQGADGLWRVNLLDSQAFPEPETSGSAFYAYGMAWGINHGILDRATYEPAIAKAWAGLLAARRADELPGFVQAVGAAPAKTTPNGTQLYASGGLLLCATELMKMAPIPAMPAPELPKYPPPAEPVPGTKAFVRYVPERFDDIAWENDRIAFRVYGPALQVHPGDGPESGQDVWVKSTRDMVINGWYKRNDYHHDHGQGLDCYEVGKSRGCGGIGIWDGSKMAVSLNWTKYKILQNGPDAASFQMDFAPYDAFGRKITESRITTLPAGSNLNKIETTLTTDSTDDLTVAIGIAKRPGTGGKLVEDKEHGILGYWEPPTKNEGSIGLGVIVDPAIVTGFAEDADNYLMIVKVKPNVPWVRYAGACWSKGLDFHDADAWIDYLKNYPRN